MNRHIINASALAVGLLIGAWSAFAASANWMLR